MGFEISSIFSGLDIDISIVIHNSILDTLNQTFPQHNISEINRKVLPEFKLTGGRALRDQYARATEGKQIGWDQRVFDKSPMMSTGFEACHSLVGISKDGSGCLFHYSSNAALPSDLFAGYTTRDADRKKYSPLSDIFSKKDDIRFIQILHNDWNLDLGGKTVFNTRFISESLQKIGFQPAEEVRLTQKELLFRDIAVDLGQRKILVFPRIPLGQNVATVDSYLNIEVP